jgi:hypothetical protein
MAGRKSRSTAVGRSDFAALLADVKGRIQAAQTRAVLAVNAELVRLYWDIGRVIIDRQLREGWSAAVIPRLARELHNELPDLKGFSERNIKLMVQLASEYPHAFASPDSIGQPAVAQLPSDPKGQLPVARIPWAHNVLLMQKVKDLPTRRWYMKQTIANGWSRNVLALQIDARAHARHGKAASNFAGIDKPIGISTYALTRALPARLRSALPTVEEIEAELSGKPLRPVKVGRKKL